MLEHEQLFYKLQIVLQSKIEEFQYLNYPSITKEQLWNYCIEKKWRRKSVPELRLYELVGTIFSVTPSEVITCLNEPSYGSLGNFAEINADEMDLLLGRTPLHD